MAVTIKRAVDIIRLAFQMIGVVGENEPLDAYKITQGIEALNLLGNQLDAPIMSTVTFDTAASQAQYTLGPTGSVDILSQPLLSLDTANIQVNQTLQYPLDIIAYEQFKLLPVREFSARPTTLYWLANNGAQSTIRFYPTPDQAYTITLGGAFVVGEFDTYSPIDILPATHQRFLKFALARELIAFYPSKNDMWTDTKEKQYMEAKNLVDNLNHGDHIPRTRTLAKWGRVTRWIYPFGAY